MIKETKILTEKIQRNKYCDICGEEIPIGLSCFAANCEKCGKDLCEKCIGHEVNTMSDYLEVYCKKCWDIGESYRKLIQEHEDIIDKLTEEWNKKCKE